MAKQAIDPELIAIGKMLRMLEVMDRDRAIRVLTYVTTRYCEDLGLDVPQLSCNGGDTCESGRES